MAKNNRKQSSIPNSPARRSPRSTKAMDVTPLKTITPSPASSKVRRSPRVQEQFDVQGAMHCPKKRRLESLEQQQTRKSPRLLSKPESKKLLAESSPDRLHNLPSLKSRMSPKQLHDVVKVLSDEQKKEVEEIGLGPLLHLGVSKLPQVLGFWLVNSYDHRSSCLILPKGKELHISSMDVHEVLGLPFGGVEVDLSLKPNAQWILEWRKEFGKVKGMVKTREISEYLKENKKGGVWFKRHFAVLVVSCLIQGQQNFFANQNILSFIQDVNSIKDLDWCGLVVKSLVHSKKAWGGKADRHFTGPLLFLMLFYVDRVVFERRTVPRRFPALIGWDCTSLSNREKAELKGGFGFGYVDSTSPPRAESPKRQESNHMEGHSEAKAAPSKFDETMVCLNEFATTAQHLAETIVMFEEKAERALELLPKNESVKKLHEAALGLLTTYSEQPSVNKDPVGVTQSPQSLQSPHDSDDFYSPSVIEAIRLIEEAEMKKKEKKDKLPKFDFSDMGGPSFNIWSQNSTPEAVRNVEPECQSEKNMVYASPESVKEMEEGKMKRGQEKDQPPHVRRSPRNLSIAYYFRSPYKNRMLDAHAGLTKEEKIVFNLVVSKGLQEYTKLFCFRNYSAVRCQFKSLLKDTWLEASIVDIWSLYLNDQERFRSAQSVRRFFFTLHPSASFRKKENSTPTKQLNDFLHRARGDMERNELSTLKGIDLFFFPMVDDKHFYLLCFNLKAGRFDIIDNQDTGRFGAKYGKIPDLLKSGFSKLLKEFEHPKDQEVTKLIPNRLEMHWRTSTNTKDCGVYLMRHMETYMGNGTTSWDCGLKKDDFRPLEILRTRYMHELLTFEKNELRKKVISDAKELHEGREILGHHF